MTRRMTMPLIALALLIAILSAGLWLTESRQYPVHQTPPSQWQFHPHLLAQQVVQDWQQHSEQFATDKPLWRDGKQPPLPATVVFQTDTALMPTADQQRWLDWVQRGGQLILRVPATSHPTGEAHSLTAWLGITSQSRRQASDANDPLREFERYRPFFEVFATHCHDTPQGANCRRIACLAPDYPSAGQWPLNGKRFTVGFSDTHQLHWQAEDAPTELTLLHQGVNALGVQMVHWQWGNGQIWAVSDLHFFDNQHLHYHDHAALLHALTSPAPLLWVNAVSAPTLAALIRDKGWPLLVAIVTTLSLVLWRVLPGKGPRLNAEPDDMDQWDETTAASQWRWQHGDRRQLLAPWIGSIKQTIHSQFRNDYHAAAAYLNGSAEQLEHSLLRLSQPQDLSDQELTELVAFLAPLLNPRTSP